MGRKIGTENHCRRGTSTSITVVHIWVLHLEGFPCQLSGGRRGAEDSRRCSAASVGNQVRLFQLSAIFTPARHHSLLASLAPVSVPNISPMMIALVPRMTKINHSYLYRPKDLIHFSAILFSGKGRF